MSHETHNYSREGCQKNSERKIIRSQGKTELVLHSVWWCQFLCGLFLFLSYPLCISHQKIFLFIIIYLCEVEQLTNVDKPHDTVTHVFCISPIHTQVAITPHSGIQLHKETEQVTTVSSTAATTVSEAELHFRKQHKILDLVLQEQTVTLNTYV